MYLSLLVAHPIDLRIICRLTEQKIWEGFSQRIFLISGKFQEAFKFLEIS